MSFGYDPEAVYQDADIEMFELEAAAETADFQNGLPRCEYKGCNRPMWRQGVCERHYEQEQREMEEARRR